MATTMESFNEAILKLRDIHEREVGGWREKCEEVSNKKGCSDAKRMEELFTRNQQLREQHRILTENIQQLENRLRAGLCDRCTVTQDVAKRRQQEYEASQIQSLQHISILASEMNALRKKNQRLQEEVRSLRGALEGQREGSCDNTSPGVNPKLDLSPVAVPRVAVATCKPSQRPADGATAVKIEIERRNSSEDEILMERNRHLKGWNGRHFESYKPLSVAAPIAVWKKDYSATRGNNGDKRIPSVEESEHLSSIPSSISGHLLVLPVNGPSSPSSSSSSPYPSASSSNAGSLKSRRHTIHAPMPCRPQPIKGGPLSFPWSFPASVEPTDWVSLAEGLSDGRTNSKLSLPRFPTLVQNHQALHARQIAHGRRPGPGYGAPKHSPPAPHPQPPPPPYQGSSVKQEKVFGETDSPLDLSDRGRSKANQSSQDNNLSTSAGEGALDGGATTDSVLQITSGSPSSSSSPPGSPSSSSPRSTQDRGALGDSKPQQNFPSEMEEATGSGDQKIPVLTISLQPVVLLETLNAGLQKASNGKAPADPDDRSAGEEEDEGEDKSVSGTGGTQSTERKRKRTEDTDSEALQLERKVTIIMEPQDGSQGQAEQG